jgi:hypothetical protein
MAMPSSDTSRIVHTPQSRAHLDRLRELAAAAGVDLTYSRTGGNRVASDSAAIRYALAEAVGDAPALVRVTPGRAPSTVASTTRVATQEASVDHDASGARLKAAMRARGLTPAAVAAEAGVSSAGYVRAAACGARGLGGRLLAWVETQERGSA